VFRTGSGSLRSGGAELSDPLPPEEEAAAEEEVSEELISEEPAAEELVSEEPAAEEAVLEELISEELISEDDPGSEVGSQVPGTGFRQAANSPRHIRTASANAGTRNFSMAIPILSDGYFRQTKNLPPQSMGTKGKPSAVPPAFAPAARTQASGNGGEAVPLSGAAPGRTKRV